MIFIAFLTHTDYNFKFDYKKWNEDHYFLKMIFKDKSLKPHIESYISKRYGYDNFYQFKKEYEVEFLNVKLNSF